MKKHSKRFRANQENLEALKVYTIEEAVAILKKTTTVKFDESVEVHGRLGIDPRKGDQTVRGSLTLPNGTGKIQKIAVFTKEENADAAKKAGADIVGGEDLVKEIQKTGKIEFDIAIATPDMMPVIGRIAKILGPKGLMPSPKTETVTPNVEKAIEAAKKGKIDFKADSDANIHQIVGKLSFTEEQIKENIESFIEALRKSKPETSKGEFILGLTLTSTMGPGLKIK